MKKFVIEKNQSGAGDLPLEELQAISQTSGKVVVAVEYAVPISVTPDVAPEGFTGSADVWERNTDFGLWLQHAWIWRFNPAGVFHDTNPLVHVH